MPKIAIKRPLRIIIVAVVLLIILAITWLFTHGPLAPKETSSADILPPPAASQAGIPTPVTPEPTPDEIIQAAVDQANRGLPQQTGNFTLLKIERLGKTIRYTGTNEVDPLPPANSSIAGKIKAAFLEGTCKDETTKTFMKQGLNIEFSFQFRKEMMTFNAGPQECGIAVETIATIAIPNTLTSNNNNTSAATASTNSAQAVPMSNTPAPTPMITPAPTPAPTTAIAPPVNKPVATNTTSSANPLAGQVQQMNQRLPQKISASSTLNRIELVANSIRFHIDNSQNSPQAQQLDSSKATLIRESCQKTKLRSFLQQGITLEYVQSYSDRSVVVSITNADCR